MESKQYYIPSLEQLHLGYSCEINTPWGWKSGIFPALLSLNPELSEFENDDLMAAAHAQLRTPFLTQEQIIAEGWHAETVLFEDDNGNDLYSDGFSKSKEEDVWYELILLDNNLVFIQKKWYRNAVGQCCKALFYGKIPSINEFKTITRLLGI